MTRILLNKGANVFVKEDEGASALFFAVQQGHLAVTKLLVKAGADLEVRNNVGQTPLYKAATKGYKEIARVLIEAGAGPNNRGPLGTTPLWAAALYGHRDVVALFLCSEASPLLTAEEEEVAPLPLDAAAQHGHVDVVLDLIQHVGIEGCGGASGGIDALCVAAEFENVGVMAALTNAGVVDTGQALCKAADSSREGSVKFLLQEQQRKRWPTSLRGGYVNAATSSHLGRTPLCCSIVACSPRVVRCLLDSGADTTRGVHNSHGICTETPLAFTVAFINELTAEGKDANEDKLRKLEAIRHLLLQVDAVHAITWLWLRRDVPAGGANGTKRTRRTTVAPAAGSPLRLTLPILRRRAGRRRVLLAAIWR